MESLYNKTAGLQAWNFIKKSLQHSRFPVNIAKFLRTPFLKNIRERLLPDCDLQKKIILTDLALRL